MEGHTAKIVLNRSQEHAVWRTVLEADAQLTSLRTVDALAEIASEAWRLTCSYDGLERLSSAASGSSDTRSFQRWVAMVDRLSNTEGFVFQARLEQLLSEFVRAGRIAIPAGEVWLVGFDAMTPAQSRLLTSLRDAAVGVSEVRIDIGHEKRVLAAAGDASQELAAAARWIRSFLAQQSDGRIAVIVPGLEMERPEIDRVFREMLSPEQQDIGAGEESAVYEFSVGQRLAETPLVRSALHLMRWCTGPLAIGHLSALLLSPHFAMTPEERGARAEFDAFELRQTRMLRPEVTLDALLNVVERSKRRPKMPGLLAALRRMSAGARRLQGLDFRSHSKWAEQMQELLDAASWGAGARENSVEFQLRRKWESALDEMVTLDFDGVPVDFGQALTAIERIAHQTTFAPESRDMPVQIMGPLEAAGGTFDAVWFLRAGEFSWPIERLSNPLLPWHMQQVLQMPGTDIELESERARRMTERIASCARTVIFSYGHETAEGRQRPSSTLSGLLLELSNANDLAGPPADRDVVVLQETEDSVQLLPLPDRILRGGARVLALQAACGFRAFAEQRLWATELQSIEPGMDARESGTVVHKMLEIFWNKVKTQETLKLMTFEEREDMLAWCISEALQRTEKLSATPWEIAYVEMQRERLRRLLHGWLDLEIERVLPFEVKLSEKEYTDVKVGPLRLSVRMDRVDLVDGGEVLIDYKTGSASPSDWLTDRPDAPQLPLYAILSDASQLKGIAYGLVRAGEGRGLRGYEARKGVLPKALRLKEEATLQAQVERWRRVLGDLAEEFFRGDARVQPKKYPDTCARCAQRLICRLDVTSLQDDGDGEPAGEGGHD